MSEQVFETEESRKFQDITGGFIGDTNETLLDKFAGQAIETARECLKAANELPFPCDIARLSYDIAFAMLAEKRKRESI